MSPRTYLDWNATAPLHDAARAAMIRAMDVLGNPSSVHHEGRAAKSLIEKARGQVSLAFGASSADIVFTSSATEAAALAMAGRGYTCAPVEHDAVSAWATSDLDVGPNGAVDIVDAATSTLQLANSETGIVQAIPEGLALCDATQAFGKMPVAFNWLGADMALVSAHKLGGPKGVGALVLRQGLDVDSRIRGGGQEMGRRSGTENIVGIAGFGAVAEAAAQELADGVWEQVAHLRDLLEAAILAGSDSATIVGQGENRLPNTSCILSSGWKGETQVMQMDLAGYAISAGSACSSGKVRASRVLQAMGFDEITSASAIRVSIGPTTKEQDILRFADTWLSAEKKYHAKAA